MGRDARAELEALILHMKEREKALTAELIRYRADDKRLAGEATAASARSDEWRRRAEAAVLAGDDALARRALEEKLRADEEVARLEADRRELARVAKGMLESRRVFRRKLAELELRQNTLAGRLDSARTGEEGPLSTQSDAFVELGRLEDALAEQAALAEADEALLDAQEIEESRLRRERSRSRAEAELAELKKKMVRP